jgi:hypothetical protein
MRWVSKILYGLMQIAVFGLTAWWLSKVAAEDGSHVSWAGVWLISLAMAAIATAILYWSIEGVKRLMGRPPAAPIVSPRGAFDNLRRKASDNVHD